jgi:5'-phosphate synthase pdxT subunit
VTKKIGVLAVQGDFIEHVLMLDKLGVKACEVRLPRDADGLDGLIIPGGESTTLSHLIDLYDLRECIKTQGSAGMAIWGTCAGMILMAENIPEKRPDTLKLMDMDVIRNAYGRQVDSFESEVNVDPFDEQPFHAVFIRAPIISRIGSSVKVLASLGESKPIAVRQGHYMATSFHPELTDDTRFHNYFVSMAGNN